MTLTQTTKVFLDTEFIDTGQLIIPLSIALVAPHQREYYAVFADAPLDQIASHPWLAQQVAPHLPIRETEQGWTWDLTHPESDAITSRISIAAAVTHFFAELRDPEIWCYFSPFDTIVLTQLYGPFSQLPPAIPAFPRDLMQEAHRRRRPIPTQQPPIHHALHDARHDLAIASSIGLVD